MEAYSVSSKLLPSWRKIAIVSICGGAGIAIMGGLLLAGFLWYTSRPTPPKSWLTNQIVAGDSPGFGVSDDGQSISFTYTLENRGVNDYRIESSSEIRILARGK